MSRGFRFLILVFAVVFITPSIGQSTSEQEQVAEQKYQERIRQEYLYGVYIPANLADAIDQLNRLIEPDSRKTFIAHSEEEAAYLLHFSFGRWMSYNWGFYQGSRLSHHLKEEFGLTFPDDQARFILVAYHRLLKQKPLELDTLASTFLDFRKKKWEEHLEKGTVIHEEKVDSLEGGGGE